MTKGRLYKILLFCLFLWVAFRLQAASGIEHSLDSDIQSQPKSVSNEDNEPIPADIREKIQKIKELERIVSSQKRFIEKLDAATIMEYPVGIVKTNGNLNYTILLNQDEITPQGGSINAFMSFAIPQSQDSLAFSASGISLSAEGGFSGDIRLNLLTNHYINLGNNIRLKILGGENKSFVTFNCEGFKNMNIAAEVEFDSSAFVCEDPVKGTVIPGKSLKTRFNITVENWNDLLVEISLDPFQIKGIKGIGFEARRIVLDFSDYGNPAGMRFPENYPSFFPEGNQNLWRGLYLQQAIVRLPSEFNRKKENGSAASENANTERTSISANNLIIDNQGLSGIFSVDHLFSAGDMNGWSFSVEKFSMNIVTNSIDEAFFDGKITVPMLDSALNYSALIGMDGDYSFTASTTSANNFSMWAANVSLAPNSTIIIRSVNGKFMPEALLHGQMTINASLNGSVKEKDKSKSVALADIKFQNLHLQTVRPYVQVGTFSFGSEKAQQAIAGFPLQIKEIGAEVNDNEAILKLRVVLNIADGGFGADGSFRIIAEKNSNKWKYKTVEVDRASIDIVTGPLKMNGVVDFFRNDSTFGNGFQGKIEAEFSMGIRLESYAMFGKIRDMRYWNVDAQAELATGIPIFTGISIYGFGGGAYYHMKQAGIVSFADRLGRTPSGLIYKPDGRTGLGLKATVVVGSSPKKEAFNGEAGFEIAFNSGGGVRFIAFSGKASFITPPIPNTLKSINDGAKKLGNGQEAVSSAPDNRGSINASLYISYDFTNNTLHGNLKTFVNIAGIIKGVGPNNSAGEAVMHFAPKEWYIYIGTPDNPVGLKFLGLAETRSYFMVGTKIPGSPPPPPEVSSILGGINTDYMKDLNSLGEGKGIAFGSSLRINTGDLTFLMFYASFKAGLGFDVMLKDYGNATCQGSSSPLGISGWYANGQAYAYVEGKIGIRIKIFSVKRNVSILDIAAAALLQAKLPNPTWLHGVVGGRFSVLGGAVKGSCKFEFTLGEECKIAGESALSGAEIIAEVTPGNTQTDISVFNAPQAVFNYAVEKPFELMETDNTMKKYRVKLDYFELMDGSSKISCIPEWNEDHNVLALKPTDLLPGKKKLKARVGVSFEEFKGGTWAIVYENGAKVTEKKESEFETGVAPDMIPTSNIQYSYPIINQYNYYKDETTIGYIKLNQGQDYLFEPASEWKQKGRFVSVKTGKKLYFNVTYDNATNEVSFNRPEGLSNGEAYRFELVNIPTSEPLAVDANVDSILSKASGLTGENEVTTKTQEAEGVIKDIKEKIFYTSNLRTSIHNTFRGKMQAFVNSPTYLDYLRINVEFLSLYSWNSEPFDYFEKYGKKDEFSPLIKAEANLSNNAWYNNLIFPSVYKDYPINSKLVITDRDGTILGIPPVKAIDSYQVEDYWELSPEMVSNETILNKKSELVTFDYNLASAIDFDAGELKTKLTNMVVNESISVTPRLKAIIEYKSPLLSKGTYLLNVSYSLPAKNITTSTVQLAMKMLWN